MERCAQLCGALLVVTCARVCAGDSVQAALEEQGLGVISPSIQAWPVVCDMIGGVASPLSREKFRTIFLLVLAILGRWSRSRWQKCTWLFGRNSVSNSE